MIVRWRAFDDTFQRMEALSHQMNEIFSEITSAAPTAETLWNPPIELVDTPDNLLLRVQLPGVDRDKLDIQVTADAVLVAGEQPYPRQDNYDAYLRSEFAYGQFRRVVRLPVEIENDQVQANFQDGVLTLMLPKVSQARRRIVKVNTEELSGEAATATLNVASETL